MSHRKWRETKQQPSRARSCYQISCCLVSLYMLCDILSGRPVLSAHYILCFSRKLWEVWGKELRQKSRGFNVVRAKKMEGKGEASDNGWFASLPFPSLINGQDSSSSSRLWCLWQRRHMALIRVPLKPDKRGLKSYLSSVNLNWNSHFSSISPHRFWFEIPTFLLAW